MNKAKQATRTAWEVNRVFCAMLPGEKQPAPFTADSGKQWERLYRNVIFHLDNPELTPAASHDRYRAEKEAAGWKYGPVMNRRRKTSPELVTFAEIIEPKKLKRRIFFPWLIHSEINPQPPPR